MAARVERDLRTFDLDWVTCSGGNRGGVSKRFSQVARQQLPIN